MVLSAQDFDQKREKAGASGKDTKLLLKQHESRVAKCRDLVVELSTWVCVNTDQTAGEAAYTPEQVTALLAGVMPWATDSGSAAAALDVHHGRLFHSAQSNVDRCVEEEALLRVEMVQLARWLSVVSERVQAALDAHTPPQAPSTSGSGSSSAEGLGSAVSSGPLHGHTHDTLADGKAHMLQRWRQRLQVMGNSMPEHLAGIGAPVRCDETGR